MSCCWSCFDFDIWRTSFLELILFCKERKTQIHKKREKTEKIQTNFFSCLLLWWKKRSRYEKKNIRNKNENKTVSFILRGWEKSMTISLELFSFTSFLFLFFFFIYLALLFQLLFTLNNFFRWYSFVDFFFIRFLLFLFWEKYWNEIENSPEHD